MQTITEDYQIKLQKVLDAYSFRDNKDKPEVISFLSEHLYLFDLLLDAVVFVKRWFPTQELVLEVFKDFGLVNDSHLVLFIVTELKAKEALMLLDKIDEDWWLDNIDRAKGKLSIDIGFV